MIDLEEIKNRINPQYADMTGTESHERKMLCDEIESLRQKLIGMQGRFEKDQDRIACQAEQLAEKDAEIKRRVTLDEMNAEVDSMAKAVADHYEKHLAAAQEAMGEYLCSTDDLPGAIRRLVSAYKERNETAAKFHQQLNEQEAEFSTKLAASQLQNTVAGGFATYCK